MLGGTSHNRLRANRISGNGYIAPGNNFGIGIISAASTDNLIEENTITGNANGVYLVAGVQGNIIRRNLITGNPPVQVTVDNPSASGLDIRNLGTPGANTFEGNTCLTSVNANCPSLGTSFSANPNPIPVTGGNFQGSTTISWNAPDAEVIEVRIGSPDGKLFTRAGNRGSIQTGNWVSDGMVFYLQDVTGGKPLTADNTLATLIVRLRMATQVFLRDKHSLRAANALAGP